MRRPFDGSRGLWRDRLIRLASFGFDDWRLLAEAIGTLIVVQIALRAVAFPRLLSWATASRAPAAAAWTPQQIERTAWLVDVGGRLTRVRCLARSLALARVLSRRGIAADVRIGVRTEQGKLEAHAWVECEGRALDSIRALQRFVPFGRALGDSVNG